MARPPLLIIFQRTFRATVFLLLHLPHNAGWLRQILQAEKQKQESLVRTCLFWGFHWLEIEAKWAERDLFFALLDFFEFVDVDEAYDCAVDAFFLGDVGANPQFVPSAVVVLHLHLGRGQLRDGFRD
jgi:hypothetical protein